MTEALVHPADTRIVVETPAAAGNPALVGLPSFLVGAFALGLYQSNLLSALGSAVPIIMTATAVGLTVAAVWAARLGQSAVASIFGIFAGFWASYAALVIGLLHSWFGLGKTDVAPTVETFLLSWLFVIGLLTAATLRLPVAFTALFGLVDVALLLLYIGWNQSSDAMLHLGGWAILGFVAVGAYIFVGAMLTELGGTGLPLGDPLAS